LYRRRQDILVGLAALVVAGGIVALLPSQVGGESLSAIGDMRSPAFFPALAALVMGALGALLALRGAVAARRAEDATCASPTGDGRRAVAVAVLLVATTLALPHAGFVPTVVSMMAGLSLAFGYRRPVVLAALCLLMPIAIFLIFEGALRVLLPRGPF